MQTDATQGQHKGSARPRRRWRSALADCPPPAPRLRPAGALAAGPSSWTEPRPMGRRATSLVTGVLVLAPGAPHPRGPCHRARAACRGRRCRRGPRGAAARAPTRGRTATPSFCCRGCFGGVAMLPTVLDLIRGWQGVAVGGARWLAARPSARWRLLALVARLVAPPPPVVLRKCASGGGARWLAAPPARRRRREGAVGGARRSAAPSTCWRHVAAAGVCCYYFGRGAASSPAALPPR